MKKLLLTILFFCNFCYANVIATMPNKAGGKIVLTNETCSYNNKTYGNLKRTYYYTQEGYTNEGCFYLEDDTIVVIWSDGDKNSSVMRYEANSFTIRKQK